MSSGRNQKKQATKKSNEFEYFRIEPSFVNQN
jgi:hypothetical protein